MSDVKCPYCGDEQEINHDDGYGFDEDRRHEQDCVSCDKTFAFTTSIEYYYTAYCQDGDHELEPYGESFPGMYGCKNCEHYERRDQPPAEDK